MELRVTGYREITKAEISIDPIAIIQGPNKSGKTSIAAACRAALLLNPAPDPRYHPLKWNKADFASLVNPLVGKKATAVLARDTDIDHLARVVWPDGITETEGSKPPRASQTAAGVWGASLAIVPEKERGKALVELIGGMATKEDVAEWFEGFSEKVIDSVWVKIQEVGWQAAHAAAKERLTGQKGVWGAIAEEAWGSTKAVGWVPQGWEKGLEKLDLEQVQKDLEAAIAHERSLSDSAAYDAGRISSLKAQVDSLAALKESIDGLTENVAKENKNVAKAKEAVAKIPPCDNGQLVHCPACKVALYIAAADVGDKLKLVKAAEGEISDKELKKRRIDYAGATGVLGKAEADLRRAENALLLRKRDIESAEQAQFQLGQIKTGDPKAMLAARQHVEQIKKSMDLVAKRNNAAKAQKAIETYMKMVEGLDPNGIRKTVMTRKLEDFNKRLAEISAAFKLATVTINPGNFDIVIGSREYRDESDSEQFRARIVLQVAIAEIDGSDMVIIDNDVDMDLVWYQRLIWMLLQRKMPALISVRADAITKAIDATKSKSEAIRNGVACYWLEGGAATRMETKEQAA